MFVKEHEMTDDRSIVGRVLDELQRASRKHGPIHSTHEGYAVIQEELDELWDAVKANDLPHALLEAEQVAAMAIRFISDLS